MAMVQREVGERLAAAPGGQHLRRHARCWRSSPARSASCARVPRTVFHPAPNVESVLVAMRRSGPAPERGGPRPRARRLRAPAQGAGRLARARAGRAGRASRRACAPRSRSWSSPPTPAPSGSRPADWPRLPASAGALGVIRDDRRPRPPRSTWSCTSGPARRTGCTRLLAVRLARAGGRARAGGGGRATRSTAPAWRGRTSPPTRSRVPRAPLPDAARRCACGSTSASRWRPASAAGAPTPPPCCAAPTGSPGRPLGPDELRASAAGLGSRRAEPGGAGPRAGHRRRRAGRAGRAAAR